jgi:hypothetical protein
MRASPVPAGASDWRLSRAGDVMSGAASDVRVLPECFSRQVVLVASTCAPRQSLLRIRVPAPEACRYAMSDLLGKSYSTENEIIAAERGARVLTSFKGSSSGPSGAGHATRSL